MKNYKKFLFICTLILCTIITAGKVNAESKAGDWRVYCPNKEISKDSTANCFLLATITEDGGNGIASVRANIKELSKLEVQGVNVLNSGEGSELSVTTEQYGAAVENATIKQYYFNNDANAKCTGAGGCYNFIANSGKTIKNHGGSNALTGTDANINNDYSTLTVIGYWTVKLTEDATYDNCGKICITVDYQQTANVNSVSGGLNGSPTQDGSCAEIHPVATVSKSCKIEDGIYYDKDGNVVSKEAYEAACQPPTKTGSFASYAVLAAGAFIALSAITIAKKHNKFYKV